MFVSEVQRTENWQFTPMGFIPLGSGQMQSIKYITYILFSQSHQRYYYGATKDLMQRLKLHNNLKVKSTKSYVPWKLHYWEEFETSHEAFAREKFFKSIDGYRWLKGQGIT